MHYLVLDHSGPIATVMLNRPDLHNAFNAELITELTQCFEQFVADQHVRAVVLTGAGASFCAGGDVHWMRSSLDLTHDDNIADAERLAAMFDTINSLPKPVIGRINGAAIGGGAGLVACCDIVIAADGAKFGFSEVKLGIIPAVIAHYVVPKIGASHARALFVSGRRFGAAHAQQIGLVHEVVPADQLDAAVERIITEVLTSGPQAIGRAKQLVSAVATLPPDEALRYTVQSIADARTSAEGQEGLQAFLDKRRPGWITS